MASTNLLAFPPRAVPENETPPIYGPGQGAPPTAAKPPRLGPNVFTVAHDNAIPLWTQWDVPTAMSALDEHTLGQFYSSGQLGDAMTMDDAFDSVISTRILGLISRAFHLEPSKKGKGNKAKVAAQALKERWDSFLSEDVITSMMSGYLVMGFFLGQGIWGYDDGLWCPTQVQPWHASSSYFDMPTRTFVANAQEGPRYICPGRGDWMLLTPFGAYRGWLRGAVRAVAIPWLARQYALRDWARYSEVHGLPIRKAKAPAGADGDDKINFQNAIANLGNETTVLLPQGIDGNPALGYDLDLLEAKADTWEAFEGLITKCETRIAIRLLGQNLTTDIDAGSLAAANVHDRVRLDYTRFDAKSLSVGIREQFLKPFCKFNYGDADLAPTPCWDTKPPEDKAVRSRSIVDVSTALANFAQAQAPVDKPKLLKQFDIPTLPDGVEAPPPPDPGAVPEKPPSGPTPSARAALTSPGHMGAISAQLYVDGLADNSKARAQKALGPHVKGTLADIRGATSYADLRKKLLKRLGATDRTRLAKVVEQALIMGELAGRHAVKKENL